MKNGHEPKDEGAEVTLTKELVERVEVTREELTKKLDTLTNLGGVPGGIILLFRKRCSGSLRPETMPCV